MTTAIDTAVSPDPAPAIDNAAANVPETAIESPGSDEVAAEVTAAAPEALLLPPGSLVIDENVRKSFDLGDHPDVTDSIRRRGVQTPVKAYRELDGSITVIEGQIRVLTALACNLALVPVWVTPAPAVDPTERAIDRIAEQINANDYRIPLTEGDRAAGMTQMFAFGASLTRISQQIGRKRDQVKLAVSVGASDTACRAVDSGQLDFEQAAVLAEYEKVGDTDAVARLLATPRSMFGYEARRIAGDRAEARQRFLESLSYAAHGFGVLTHEPDADSDRFLNYDLLRTADGHDITTADLQATAADWVVYLYPTDEETLVERDTGAVIDRDTVDWSTQDRPDATPADGLRHANTVDHQTRWEPTCYLRAERLTESGFRLASDFEQEVVVEEHIDVAHDVEAEGTAVAVVPQESPDDGTRGEEAAQPAARQREEAARVAAERQDQERQAARRVRELNKQGQAALETRREFLTGYLTRKTSPPLAAVFVAETLADEPGLLSEYNADRTAHELLGVSGWRSGLLAAISTAKPNRCQVITLGLVLGAYEKRTGKDAWRYTDRGVRRYLHFLADNGHHLTPVEQAAAGDIDPNTIDIDS
ncbi:ParB/RepB/Spo0J family partition protein [Nocardia uniformis]|uniref:ParB/RepB/Spo0J family partition protein n=1 Tax=Nocardia uniformis TaxID=53432 RepID=UPI000A7C7FC6|nr:chromosome partitioning protein ParB [Nocardia uniformis]